MNPSIYESHGKKPAPRQISEYITDSERVRSTHAGDRTGSKYKYNRCNAGQPHTPQTAFLTYQTHSSVQHFWNAYIDSFQVIDPAKKEFIVPETKTASCGVASPVLRTPYAAGLYFIDLALQGASIGMEPVYKDDQPTKRALFNRITDPSGTNDSQFNLPRSQPSVMVKYPSTATGSTADKVDLAWAGQTMGDQFGPNDRLARRRGRLKPSNATPVPAQSPSKLLICAHLPQ
ncbi:hypothetical protein FS837_002407 [Tulasnella sp. UAMH 9824]|nr:hypothetical protein FS837_002407 [Tulasnella sp. UAMH 9824]